MTHTLLIAYRNNVNQTQTVLTDSNYQAVERAHDIALRNPRILYIHVRNENGILVGGYTRSLGNLTRIWNRA